MLFVPDIFPAEYVMVLGNVSILCFCPLIMLGNDKAVAQPTLGMISQRNILMALGSRVGRAHAVRARHFPRGICNGTG